MTEQINKHVLSNGMVILAEPMDYVESVSFNFLLPCGSAYIPKGSTGAGNVICDWIFRGAGDYDSRQMTTEMDNLGIHRSASQSTNHLVLNGALESSNLHQAIDLFAQMILKPHLDAEQFELSRQLALHELSGLDDDPRQKVMIMLSEQFYPDPYGRSSLGTEADLQSLTAAKTAELLKRTFDFSNAIFSIAGKFDFQKVCKQLEALFDVPQTSAAVIEPVGQSGQRYTHIKTEGAQVHIGLMTKVPPITQGLHYQTRAAVSILSGGMSSRLFTEVREKRGLCYAVGAKYTTLRDYAGINCYAGTTPDKAQETIDVIMREFNNLSKDISKEEMHRAKVGLKSSLIMQTESTLSRAGGIAGDYFLLGRVRKIDEIRDAIEALTIDSVCEFLNTHKFEDYTVVTLGPKQISF